MQKEYILTVRKSKCDTLRKERKYYLTCFRKLNVQRKGNILGNREHQKPQKATLKSQKEGWEKMNWAEPILEEAWLGKNQERQAASY